MSPIDRELERTLVQRAGSLEPPADLYAAVTKEAGAMRRRRQGAVAGAALTVLAIAVAVPLALRSGDDKNDNGLTNSPTPTPSVSVEPSVEPSAVDTPTATPTTAPPAQIAAVPVYYVGTKGRRPVLYREFQRADVAGGKAFAAVSRAVGSEASDADYDTPFPAGSAVNHVDLSGGLATIDLNARAAEGTGGAELENAVVQALVWTVTAADTSVKTVNFTVNGVRQADFWGHVDFTGTFRREAQENILAPVWILQPEPGSKVGRTFTLGGQATVFEANVTWEVLAGGTKVASGFATASQGAPARGDWSSSVTIPASVASGTKLELRAYESSAEDGSVQWLDTKTVTLA